MDEKTGFTVSDRRKFTTEGELREENASPQASEAAEPATRKPAEKAEPAAERPAEKIVSMPRREAGAAPAGAKPESSGKPEPARAETQVAEGEVAESESPQVTAQESAEQHAAYRASSETLDQMLKQANPGMEETGPVTFEHVIQSIYLSAMIAMGAGTEQGQKPRVDILGARQSIDMLSVLQEKTKGNLSEREQRMLQSALFELQMMFLEITNAIAQASQQPPKGKG